jgi:hypothetical protein
MPSHPTIRRSARAVVLALSATLASGCSSVKTTGTSRSGTEQLLLTGAWDSALCSVDFRPLAGTKVYVDPQFVTVTDKDWILSSTRRVMAEHGVLLQDAKDKADVIVEIAVGAYGTDDRSCSIGLPQIGFMPTMFGSLAATAASASSTSSSSSSTSLTLKQTNKQDAVVKAALFAYETKTGRLMWDSGPILNAEGIRDHYALGYGPLRVSSLPEVKEYPAEAQARSRIHLGK